MQRLQVLKSGVDRSTNFVEEQLVGFLESRYVRKGDDYFIAYLSSQTGCNRGCTFCHLTATGQTSFTDSTRQDFTDQAVSVFRHYRAQNHLARYVHFNFMARGEALANSYFLNHSNEVLGDLGVMAQNHGLPAKFNVSTIMPRTFKGSLIHVFPVITPTIYYSLYSMNEEWRQRWLPGAMPAIQALEKLKEYQDFSKKIVKIHHSLIAGENDSDEDAWQIEQAVRKVGLHVEFNLVRYNPASPAQGTEAARPAIDRYLMRMERLRGKVQEIPRVGPDVFASCGMFITGLDS
jgi:23S rRNA (adenine2503-C2)-methyltransferase